MLHEPWPVWLSGLSVNLWSKGHWFDSQCTCLGCGPGAQDRACERQPYIDVKKEKKYVTWDLCIVLRNSGVFKQKTDEDNTYCRLIHFFNPHLRLCLLILGREEGREKERNIDVREKHQLVASHVFPGQGWNPQPFGVWDDAPTNQDTRPGHRLTLESKKRKYHM